MFNNAKNNNNAQPYKLFGQDYKNNSHNTNFKAIYETMLEVSMSQNRKLQDDIGMHLHNFDKIYGQFTETIEDGRTIMVRWVKIPTFTKENRPRYYIVFMVNINHWHSSDIRHIRGICLNSVDLNDVDQLKNGYTIYLCGRQKGFYRPGQLNHILYDCNTVVINSNCRHTEDARGVLFRSIWKYLYERLNSFLKKINSTKSKTARGLLKKDYLRLNDLVKGLDKLWHNFYKIYREIKKDADIILSNIRIKSSHSHNSMAKMHEKTAIMLNQKAEAMKLLAKTHLRQAKTYIGVV